ncbi:MAG: DNA recombination protein RmuC [Acidobacteriia bacterium]|nr:DNA recombination protein RmuC [Terriglobia bacterium]
MIEFLHREPQPLIQSGIEGSLVNAVTGIIAAAGFAAGFLVAWLWVRASSQAQKLELEKQSAGRQGAAEELGKQSAALQEQLRSLQARVEQEQQLRAAAVKEAEGQRANIAEQKRLLEESEKKLKEAFQSLASEALQASSKQFMDLAGARFQSLQKEASGDLEQRKIAIGGMVEPLQKAVEELRAEVTKIESARQEAYGGLRTEVQQLATTSKELRVETGSLVSSLKQPQVKGRWGELTLRRAVELAGMSPHCDFVEQVSVDVEEGRLRPDLIVHLPGDAQIVVDAKVPLHASFAATTARSDEEYRAAMEQHAALVRDHVNRLSLKEYWKQFEHTPEFVVLFVPGESFFSAALEHDRTLIEDAIEKRVVLASPTTLIALLRAIAYGWNQQVVTENAEKIKNLGKELYERILKFAEHLADVAKGLERANKAYNSAVSSFDSRLVPSVRKFNELGVGSAPVPDIDPIETSPRPTLSAADADEERFE